MSKALIIAEKPSVARDIARSLRGFKKQGDYYESDQYLLSSAIGHLLELCVPDEYQVKRGKWSFEHLPIVPPSFDLKPIKKTLRRLDLLVRLIKRKDVDYLVNACDAGREGELIFRYIVQFAGATKPIRRLWLQSMIPAAVREAFASLRDDEEMRPLAAAAKCRSESDWLVGINGTRAMTAFNSKLGGFQLTKVGRVQTPTLVIVVDREKSIKKFVPRDYWEVHGTFQAAAGDYPGRWFDEHFSKDKDGDLKPERIWNLSDAEAIRQRCFGKPGVVTEESKASTRLSPLLFDLTSLQREANGRFGFSARRTLQIAQALYERHKALTYPRTAARALPEDYLGVVKKTLGVLAKTSYGDLAASILKKDWVRPHKRIFNNAKISDHFAIIPTLLSPKRLKEEEAKIYDLVVRRFLAIFYPPAEFQVTIRITRVENDPFKSEGKVLVKPGWLTVYGKESQIDDTPSLAPVQPDEHVRTRELEIVKAETRPPARFTEATLLSAMEGAGKLIEDDELREAMRAKGLGTPATRAAIIEGLIRERYLVRQGRELQPTAKAFSLVVLLRGLDVPELCSPELTGDWEFKLNQIEQNQLNRDDFMRDIASMTRRIVDKAKSYEHDTIPGDFGVLNVPCPKCGGIVKEIYKQFRCQSCDFAVWKTLAARQFEISEMEELMTKRSVGPLHQFRSHKGRLFSAIVKLAPDFKMKFDFGNQDEGPDGESRVVDFFGQESVGKCPKCGAGVFENGLRYVCEKSVGKEGGCDFRSGMVILQQSIDRAQMRKLLETGKTDLLTGFISRKGRPFRAYLVVGEDGMVGFEFIKKPKRKGKGTKEEVTTNSH